ncbi:hypothetical protein [Candidatus Protochlamydia sp. R18]|uniref:hypothetical protein n=1 Tax=Candidatus Protochlamydia sp. R18 TaxID=1353977 RepID=UPI0013923AF8|nr:hypothetical protein [Candidatus Protochlamydia sp. R18]
MAYRARENFESFGMNEKRQLLNFVFQNLKLDGKNLSLYSYEPFTTLVNYKKCPKEWGNLGLNQETERVIRAVVHHITQNHQSLMVKMLRDFIGFKWLTRLFVAPPLRRVLVIPFGFSQSFQSIIFAESTLLFKR